MAENVEADEKVVVMAIDAAEHSDHAFELTNLKDSTGATAEDKRIKHVLDKFEEKLRTYGVGGRVRKVAGKPGKAVIQVAIEEKASLIVTGSRDLSGIRRTFTDSVSDYILRHASCPVLICTIKNTKGLISSNAGNGANV